MEERERRERTVSCSGVMWGSGFVWLCEVF